MYELGFHFFAVTKQFQNKDKENSAYIHFFNAIPKPFKKWSSTTSQNKNTYTLRWWEDKESLTPITYWRPYLSWGHWDACDSFAERIWREWVVPRWGKWPFPPPVLTFLLSLPFNYRAAWLPVQRRECNPGSPRPTSPAQKPKLGTHVDSVRELPLITWS